MKTIKTVFSEINKLTWEIKDFPVHLYLTVLPVSTICIIGSSTVTVIVGGGLVDDGEGCGWGDGSASIGKYICKISIS